MSSGYQWGNPGDDLTRNNRFSRLLLQQDVNAAPIRSHPQGLASLLRQGMAGFMMGADRREGREASEATSRGMTAEPWTDPDTGETVGTAGGFEGAISALQKLPGNEHAQRSLQGLLMQRMETQAATAARDEERSYAELQRPIYEIVENPLGRGGVGKVDQFGNLSNYQGPAKAAVPTLTSIFDEQGLEQKGYMGEGGGFTPVGGAKAQGGSETRPTAKDANGVLRYLDDGKRVFDQETVGPALPDEGENFDRETKTSQGVHHSVKGLCEGPRCLGPHSGVRTRPVCGWRSGFDLQLHEGARPRLDGPRGRIRDGTEFREHPEQAARPVQPGYRWRASCAGAA